MGKEKDEEADGTRPMVEWVVGGVSALLVLCLVLYLGRQALFGEGRPADLYAAVERVSQRDDATTVTVAVANRGDEAASAVAVLALGLGTSIARRIEFDYVAARAVRRGAFVFPGRVGADEVRIEIGGYSDP